MTPSSEAPDTGPAGRNTWDTEPAAVATAAFTAIQAPVWGRIQAARQGQDEGGTTT